jgi:asparagine synthase (glutamine-hydrolysing)
VCGICGVIQVGGAARRVVGPEVLDRMTDAMLHRGPDDRGTHLADGVALGVRRLSIVDVAGGHQPVFNEDGAICAVQNGELYNHGEIRSELRRDGHTFASRCDTEILPHLYERDRENFPKRLRGMFGLCVWDAGQRRAVVARDRLGIKPLYYAHHEDLVVFASELKSVLLSGLVSSEIDYEAIDAYLSLGFFPGPLTPLRAVRKLLPGHVLIVDPNGVRTQAFWKYPPPQVSSTLTLADQASRLVELLEESVRLRLMSDVPLGAMLSGGLDSSVIVALMARNMGEPVKTFSVGFFEDGDGNECADARLVAERFSTDHHELQLSYTDATVDFAELIWHLDEPLADLSSLGFHALSRLAAESVTVALSGQGADELFGGYSKHRAATVAAVWGRVPRPLRRVGLVAAHHGPARVRRMARTLEAVDSAERLLAMSGRLDDGSRKVLYRGPMAEVTGRAARNVIARIADGVPDDPLPTTLFIDGQLALVDDMLHYFDKTSMAHSLEVRVPFLDHHVVEYAATVPANQKVRRLETKVLLKYAARGLIPDQIIDKRKLGFFAGSASGWLRSQADRLLVDYLLASSPRIGEFLDAVEVRRLVDKHLRGSDDDTQLILSLLMLEIWLQTYLPRVLAPRPSVPVARGAA